MHKHCHLNFEICLNIFSDLLCVIAHGTPTARAPAANLLFYYWPNLNPTHFDRRNMLNRCKYFITFLIVTNDGKISYIVCFRQALFGQV